MNITILRSLADFLKYRITALAILKIIGIEIKSHISELSVIVCIQFMVGVIMIVIATAYLYIIIKYIIHNYIGFFRERILLLQGLSCLIFHTESMIVTQLIIKPDITVKHLRIKLAIAFHIMIPNFCTSLFQLQSQILPTSHLVVIYRTENIKIIMTVIDICLFYQVGILRLIIAGTQAESETITLTLDGLNTDNRFYGGIVS